MNRHPRNIMQATLVDNSKEIFERPKTVEAILKGREPIRITHPEDLIPTAENRGNRPLLLYGFDIIPSEFYDAVNFGKRGPLVELETFDGDAKSLRDEEWSDLTARIHAAEERQNKKESYVGWTWIDPEGRNHVLRPTTNVIGHMLHARAQSLFDRR